MSVGLSRDQQEEGEVCQLRKELCLGNRYKIGGGRAGNSRRERGQWNRSQVSEGASDER